MALPVILINQQYHDPSREKELARCRWLNENAEIIDKIETVDGSERRWTFGELYSLCCQKHHGRLCVIANSDIAFDVTRGLRSAVHPTRLTCLTRWEDDSGPRFIGHQFDDAFFSGSQDAWAFVAGTVPIDDIAVPMGTVGCDQVIAGAAASKGIRVSNPSLTIRTRHVHATKERPDRPSVTGLYGYPHLTTLEGITNRVVGHLWPNSNGEYKYDWVEWRP